MLIFLYFVDLECNLVPFFFLTVCSTTLWLGHLSKLVTEDALSNTFGNYGKIVSIKLIPPRGCDFGCMNRRQDADKALRNLKHVKLHSKAITVSYVYITIFYINVNKEKYFTLKIILFIK